MPLQACYARIGKPSEVLTVENLPSQPLQAHEVRVGQIVAPINPADLNGIEGSYPIQPPLPATPGVEGAGVVLEVGKGVKTLSVGQKVLFPNRFGSWREEGVALESELHPVPEGVPLVEAAMLKINPATAWRMLNDFVPPTPGNWVVQNAANSAVGRHIIAMARELELKTINLVRRETLIDELTALGGDIVLLDDDEAPGKVVELTRGAPVPLALNAVGGESGNRLARILSHGGIHVTYGGMSRKALALPAGNLIFKDLTYRGFWVSHWYLQAPQATRLALFTKLFDFARRGLLRTPIEEIYPLSRLKEAVERAAQGSRDGKILVGVDPR